MYVIGIDPSLRGCGVSDGDHSVVLKTIPENHLSQERDTIRRVEDIVSGIGAFVTKHGASAPLTICIEGPVLNMQGASHLYEVGFLYSAIYRGFPGTHIIKASPAELKKYITGKGNTKKDKILEAVETRWKVNLRPDAGADKAHAFALAKLGQEIIDGTYAIKEPARRGTKRKKKSKDDTRNTSGRSKVTSVTTTALSRGNDRGSKRGARKAK